MQPLLDIVERLLISDIVDNNDTMCTTVVRGCNGTETFLASGIPDLQLDGLAVKLNGADLEIDTNGGDVRLSVGVVSKTKEKTGLSYTRITNKEKLEKIIAKWRGKEKCNIRFWLY
eukprot:TRINITY_DN4015_c0_g2_i2.p1 TRINITY_DN4015_c0_g2~~TRINITY_DN4015_c0_g2_i2.p1  ORF type:complete len:116 (-),score=8.99 TRINITY_DN4015_c0_g2_i2:275-622(-)